MSKTASGLPASLLRPNGLAKRGPSLPPVPQPGAPISAAAVEAIEKRVIQAASYVPDIPQASEWLDQAKAIEAYLRSRELQRPMLGAQRRLEARIGELLGPEPGKGRSEMSPHADSFHRERRKEFRLLSRFAAARGIQGDEWRRSRRALVAYAREVLGEKPETPPLPEGKFSCIVADPPWTLDTGPDTWGGTGESGHDSLSYSQMSVDEIAALKVPDIRGDAAHLYLWTTNRYIEAAYDVARAWGFKPSVLLVWAKPIHGVGLGDTFRLTTEFILFARHKSLPHLQIVPRSWFDWPRGKHSVKPDAFYEMVEAVSPGPRLDMFARRERSGWEVWGDEV